MSTWFGLTGGIWAAGKEKRADKDQPKVSMQALREIAAIKSEDEMNVDVPMESIVKSLIGTCKSMGVVLVP